MKKLFFASALIVLVFVSVFGSGISQMELVNEQKIELKQIDTIEIRYHSENIKFYSHNSDTLIIKEYMTENNSGYFAKINNAANNLVVEAGKRPINIFPATFRAEVEIYIPMSNKNITIKTNSGKIEGAGECSVSSINLECSSGSMSINSIKADTIKLTTTSGSIRCNNADGDTAISTSSGSISVSVVKGDVNAKSTSGNIQCTASRSVKDISITASSGSVTLDIPRDLSFKFSARTSSGRLTTPFSDQLFSPFSDKNFAQGNIGLDDTAKNQVFRNIDITTSSGSIRVNWVI